MPLLGRNDYMMGVLKSPEKLATFFSLMTEPETIPVNEMVISLIRWTISVLT